MRFIVILAFLVGANLKAADAPDPTSPQVLYSLLSDDHVCSYLDLSDQIIAAARESKRKYEKELRALRKSQPNRGAIREFLEKRREYYVEVLEEALNPTNYKRLQQVGYRIEINRIGFPEAIAKGHLGKAVGISEAQEKPIKEFAASVTRQLRLGLTETREKAEADILGLLTPDQRKLAVELLGRTADFSEDGWMSQPVVSDSEMEANARPQPPTKVEFQNGQVLVGPDPESTWELFELIDHPTVRDYLELSSESLRAAWAIKDEENKVSTGLHASAADDPTPLIIAYRGSLAAKIEKAISTDKLALLRHIAYRLEVDRMGLPDSLAFGRLSRAIDVYDSQIADFWRKANTIEDAKRERMSKLVRDAEWKVFSSLTEPQKEKALAAVGATWDFRELTRPQLVYRRVMKARGLREGLAE